MPSRSGFFSLPRELREIIYHHYVFEADGYHFDYESGKLRASGNRPIDLALMCTCSSVAAEMHHLALRINVLHFSTLETERVKAARFDMLCSRIHIYRANTLGYLKDPRFHRYNTADVEAKVALRYPQFEPLLHCPQTRYKPWPPSHDSYCFGSSWGEADSVFRAFQGYLVELLSRDTEFPEALANLYDRYPLGIYNGDRIDHFPDLDLLDEHDRASAEKSQRYARERASFLRSKLLLSIPEPWTIPSEDELAQIYTTLGPSYHYHESNSWERVQWRFSAAAAAIHFFKSVSLSTCLGIRNVVLHEDRLSVAHPECHVLGLIPFCLQNPQLHIERRVNMWKVLLVGCFGKNVYEHSEQLEDIQSHGEDCYFDRFSADYIGRICCRWITEASALSAHGMPAESFSLVLDGDPAPDQSSEVFEIVKEDAAWQVAQIQWYTDQSLSPGFVTTRRGGFYMSDVFPRAINDIVAGKSFIRCNFPTGNPYDPQRVLDGNRQINHDPIRDPSFTAPGAGYVRARVIQRVRHNRIRPSPPLPSRLSDLALEDLISEEQLHAA